MICTNKFYSFGPNNPICEYDSSPPHMRYSVDQVPPPIGIGLDDTWDTKGSNGHVSVSHPGAGSIFFVPSAWNITKIELSFGVTGKGITYIEKQAYAYYVLLF